MINIFRQSKCQIRYVEELGAPEKALIITAKTIEQAKEEFRQFIGDKTIVSVKFIMIP